MSPTWSPDGRKVAYVSFENKGLPSIYVHELATTQRERVSSFKGINGAPDWSPDGQKLALTLSRDGNPEIYMLDLNTKALTRLTQHYGIDTEPRWLPDGKSLVFTSSRSGGPQIYKLNINDKSVRRVSFQGAYNARSDVTPDGRYLVYVHRRNGSFNVGVQDLQRGTFNIVTRTDMDESPSVAPNGSMVIYGTQDGGTGFCKPYPSMAGSRLNCPRRKGKSESRHGRRSSDRGSPGVQESPDALLVLGVQTRKLIGAFRMRSFLNPLFALMLAAVLAACSAPRQKMILPLLLHLSRPIPLR